MTHVRILLASRNGEAFLAEQLQSFVDQDHEDWSLWVSDDASTDATRAILGDFKQRHQNRDIRLFDGPNRGLFNNFMSLLRQPALPVGYIALSDQDDLWLPHKLSRGLERLKALQSSAFYCSTQIVTNADLEPLTSEAPRPLPPPSFQNAMVQNIASGNTIMLNPAALRILRNDPMPAKTPPFHDWWIYFRLMASDATLICDPTPGLFYRQHENNYLGIRKFQRRQRLRALWDGTFGSWIAANAASLVALPCGSINPAHRSAAETLLRDPLRLQALRRSGAVRHDLAGRCLLLLLAGLRRI